MLFRSPRLVTYAAKVLQARLPGADRSAPLGPILKAEMLLEPLLPTNKNWLFGVTGVTASDWPSANSIPYTLRALTFHTGFRAK